MRKRNQFIRLRVICAATEKDLGCLAKRLHAHGFRVGKAFWAKANPLTEKQVDSGWQATWTIQHFDLPFTINKKPDAVNRTRRNYYIAPGITGLIFTDCHRILDVRDTRRNSDWDKLHDKRVVRRMYRQMAKNFGGNVDLKLARSHKR